MNNIIFKDYAVFYDTYYSDKDYKGEIEYVLKLGDRCGVHHPEAILDMGCGTANHMMPLAMKGIKVDGFDLSKEMVTIGREKIKVSGHSNKLSIDEGDLRYFRNDKKYDIVIAMFAVMGYLRTNEDFIEGLNTAKTHLKEGGVFIFDVWHGPAVLNCLPETRIQRFDYKGERVVRLVEPSLNVTNNTVDVSFQLIKLKNNNFYEETKETHTMRYFFKQELEFLMDKAGLQLENIYPFMKLSNNPSIVDWNMTVVSKIK